MYRKYERIGLFDHMGLGNMGDAAIQEAFIANIRRRLPHACLVSFSLYPDDTQKRHGIRCHPIRWCYPGWNGSDTLQASVEALKLTSWLKMFLKRHRMMYVWAKPIHDLCRELVHLIRSYKIVRSLDLLVISGGGQLCELYGDLPYNVFKFCVLARLAGKPVYIVGVGADLLKQPLNRFFARWSVRLAHYVSFRSAESQALIRGLGVKRETHVCPDPAYSLDPVDYPASTAASALTAAESRALFARCCPDIETKVCSDPTYILNDPPHQATKPSDQSAPKVGLNPIRYCDPRCWPRKKDGAIYRRYMNTLVEFCAWLLAHNYRLEVFTSEVTSDLIAIEDLKNGILTTIPSDAKSKVFFRPVLTLKELFLQMSTFDFVVTSKFHGVVFSHLLGKPVIALSYLQKIDHLMQAVGHGEYCAGVEQCTTKWLIERFEYLVHERARLASLFRQTSAIYAAALQAEFDRLLLVGALPPRHESYCGSIGGGRPGISRVPLQQ